MATTTTNYGWTVPTSSDLVKNGATAISTVGSSVDTALWNSGFGQAGKNKVINGNFGIWQRGTSFAPSAAGFYYTADRWVTYNYATSATTVSQQSFTAGTAPVAGYESQYFLRITSTNTAAYIESRIEDVRTFAGQTATLSFWAKSASAQTLSTFKLYQAFGSGGSANVDINGTAPTLTTSWARYSFTFTVPSIAGKTIGTGSSLTIGLGGAINNALDLWGVQLEYGSTATPFQLAGGGSQQAELAMCQRYYYRQGGQTYSPFAQGWVYNTTGAFNLVRVPVTMRVVPTSIDYAGTIVVNTYASSYTVSSTTISTTESSKDLVALNSASTLMVAGQPSAIRANNDANAYLGLSAEL